MTPWTAPTADETTGAAGSGAPAATWPDGSEVCAEHGELLFDGGCEDSPGPEKGILLGFFDDALAAEQPTLAPTSSGTERDGGLDRWAITSAIGATFGDYAGNEIQWPVTQEFADRVIARLVALRAIRAASPATPADSD